jgi:uncharacterized protein YegJ (DUF2314 family)
MRPRAPDCSVATNEDTMRIVTMAVIGAALMFAGWYFGKANDQSVLARAKRDEAFLVTKEDPAMAAARSKARATLAAFLATARQPTPAMRNFALKVKVSDDNGVEYFWVTQFNANGGRFSGKIDNTPRMVRSVAAGQIIEFSEGEITDWMYMDGGKMKGNYSACALLQREPKDQQDAVKNRFGLNCDA